MRTLFTFLMSVLFSFSVFCQTTKIIRGKSTAKTVSINMNSASKSDVDINIPEQKKNNPYRFALIIGNQDYHSYQKGLENEIDVQFAQNDATVFKEYLNKTLGVPEQNTIFLINASTVEMHRAIEKLNLLIKNSKGKGEFFIYFAGHGFPDETSAEAYLLPVDVTANDLQFAVKLKDLYDKLLQHPSKRITVFIDACFSGGARGQGLLTGRRVKIKPRTEPLSGNIVVFTASSEKQSALAYDEKEHGLFTYFILKKWQTTSGDVNYGDFFNYLDEKIGIQSVLINEKEQTPQVNISSSVKDQWREWQFLAQ